MATPLWVRKMLELRGIPFEELHHPEVYTAQEVAQREHVEVAHARMGRAY